MIVALACVASMAGRAAALEGARYQVTLHPVSGWTKSCSADTAAGKTACYTSRRFGQDPRRPPILDLSIRVVEGDASPIVRLLLPNGLRTDLGLSFSVDGGDRQPGAFKGCVPNGCLAEAKLATAVLAAMRKGGTMQIVTTDKRNRRVDFYLSLNGFAAVYDGPGQEDRSAPPPGKAPMRKAAPRPGGTNI